MFFPHPAAHMDTKSRRQGPRTHDSGYEIGDDSTEPVQLLKREEFLSYKM